MQIWAHFDSKLSSNTLFKKFIFLVMVAFLNGGYDWLIDWLIDWLVFNANISNISADCQIQFWKGINKVSFNLVQWFQRRFKCENITMYDRWQMSGKTKSSHSLWPFKVKKYFAKIWSIIKLWISSTGLHRPWCFHHY